MIQFILGVITGFILTMVFSNWYINCEEKEEKKNLNCTNSSMAEIIAEDNKKNGTRN